MDIKKLIDDLNASDEADRLYAAEDLGAANTPGVVNALAQRLALEKSRAVKERIFHALAAIHDEAVMLAAIALIEADDAFVRNEAVRLLGTFGDAAMPALTEAVESKDTDVRKFLLDAISTINTNLKENIYRKLLSDADINIVITAVEHIGRDNLMLLRESVEAVMEQATHPMLISACVKSLGRIGNAGSLNAMYRKLGGDGMAEHLVYCKAA
jgi:HEAT repeat protein